MSDTEMGQGHVVGFIHSSGFHALTFPQKDEPTDEIAPPPTIKATPKKRSAAKNKSEESPSKKGKTVKIVSNAEMLAIG